MKNERLHLFFSGIGGSGVSAIARFIAARGHSVSGSDRAFAAHPDHPACTALKECGIAIFPPDGSGVTDDLSSLIYSTAVEQDQPDLVRARALGIPMTPRPDYLAQIASDFRTIAVAGTSGKSTVSGMLAFLMNRLGLEPNFIGGGRVKQFRTANNPGNSLTGQSDILVMEACESDGSIVNYHPHQTILLNLDLDHHLVEETESMFETLIRHTAGSVIINRDDRNLSRLSRDRFASFSVDTPARYQAQNIELHPLSSGFTVRGIRFGLSLPGSYNICNALACIACLAEMGISLEAIAAILPEFSGIERRFDVHRNDGHFLVVDDYAHNPHKIASMMQAMQPIAPRICYVFQPHGYGPARMMKNEYISAFAENLRQDDRLVLLPIFYAGGTAQKDISSEDLAGGVRERGKSAEAVTAREQVFDRLADWNSYVIFGARDESLSTFAEEIARRLTK